MKTLTFEEAEKRLLEVLGEMIPGMVIDIYWWDCPPAGPRLAEVSASNPDRMAGYSYMQVEPGCAELLFRCERFVLDLMYVPEDAEYSEEVLRTTFKD